MKRKAPTPPKEGLEASRAQRKRVQNRISQKCHRERQAAHARHLETVVDIFKAGDQEVDNDNDRYTALLQLHMKLIEEKHKLEESLFRMRKKLLSISSSAAAAADDEAVDALGRSKNRTKPQSEPSPSTALRQTESSNTVSPENTEEQFQNEMIQLDNVTVDGPSARIGAEESQVPDLANSHDISAPTRSVLPPVNWNSDSEQQGALVDTVAAQLTAQDQSYAWSFGAMELTFPLEYSFSIPQPTKAVIVTSSTIFAETILHACRKYVGLRSTDLGDDPMISHDLVAYGRSKEVRDMKNVAQISAIGVNMLAAFAGLESYVYGVGAAPIMESLVQWRLMPTFANRIAVPEPFRPTPLQYSTSDYPLLLDFINWPAIRDQLILQSRTINIDEIVRDVVQNTVVEIPPRHVSVNVLRLFYNTPLNPSNHVSWNNDLKTAITDAHWKYLEISAPAEPDFISPDDHPTPAESALVQEISRRMDTGSNASSPEEIDQLSNIDTISTPRCSSLPQAIDNLTGSWSTATQRRNEIVKRFELDQVTKWKLSKEFARKYPFLDCSSAVAAYDMVSAQSALEAEAMVC